MLWFDWLIDWLIDSYFNQLVFNYVVFLCVCRQKNLNGFRWKTCFLFLIFHMSYETVISIFASVKSLCVQKKCCHLIVWDLFWLYHSLSHTLYFSYCVHQLKKVKMFSFYTKKMLSFMFCWAINEHMSWDFSLLFAFTLFSVIWRNFDLIQKFCQFYSLCTELN